jgi:DUF1680 family protein
LADRLRFNLGKLIRDRKTQHTLYSGWGADQIGRWIGATILEATLLGATEDLPAIREKVQSLIAAQDGDGFYYGKELRTTPERLRECWFGQGRGIWNLLEYYNVTGDRAAFDSLLKAADLCVAKRGEWTISKPLCGGIESVVSPMARLGQMTHRKPYIDYARYMADNVQHQVARPSSEPTAHVESTHLHTHDERPFYHHTHSYLNTTHGVVDLAVVTGEVKYVDLARKIFEDSFSSVWITGDFPESYGDYYERCDETCSAVDWMVLALKLYAVTGEARFLDAAELTLLNHLPCSQDHVGNFTTYRSINRHHWMDKDNRGGAQTDCCSMSGGWGLAQAALYAVTIDGKGLSINLPVDVDARVQRSDKDVVIHQAVQTEPYQVVQTVTVHNASPGPIEIRVRVPYWCCTPGVSIDGRSAEPRGDKGFFHLSCPGNALRSIQLRLPMMLQVVPARRHILNADRPDGAAGDATEQGLQYGPYVLMLNRQMYPKILDKDIHVTLTLDRLGHPRVSQEVPRSWDRKRGVVPLFIEAELASGASIYLTPCANLALTPLTVKDPYVMRFTELVIKR